jgi:hypothetical protein
MKYATFIVGLLLLPFAVSVAPVKSQSSSVPVKVRVTFNSLLVTRKVDPIGNRPAEAYGRFRVNRSWQNTSSRVWARVGQKSYPGWVFEERTSVSQSNPRLNAYVEVHDKDPGKDDRLLSSVVRVRLQDCTFRTASEGFIEPKDNRWDPGRWNGNTCVIGPIGLPGRKAEADITLEIGSS